MSIVISLNKKQHEWLKTALKGYLDLEAEQIYAKITKDGTKIAPIVINANQTEPLQ